MVSKTFIKNIVTACMFKIVKGKVEVSNLTMSNLLGATTHQIGVVREIVEDMLVDHSMVKRLQRKVRKDRIREKLEPNAFDFICDDLFTRLDSNLTLVDVINPRSENKELVSVHQRIWVNANKKQRHIQFLESEHYANFQ